MLALDVLTTPALGRQLLLEALVVIVAAVCTICDGSRLRLVLAAQGLLSLGRPFFIWAGIVIDNDNV